MYHQFCTWSNYSLFLLKFLHFSPNLQKLFLMFSTSQFIQNTFWENNFHKKVFLKKKNQKKLFIFFGSNFFCPKPSRLLFFLFYYNSFSSNNKNKRSKKRFARPVHFNFKLKSKNIFSKKIFLNFFFSKNIFEFFFKKIFFLTKDFVRMSFTKKGYHWFKK